MDKKYIFGIGTGRCGTSSLAALLDKQENASFTHEHKSFRQNWSNDDYKPMLDELNKRKSKFCGDVGFYLFPRVQKMLQDSLPIKIIILERPLKEFVRSFENRWKSLHRNPLSHFKNNFNYNPDFDFVFPNYYILSRKMCLEKYWYDYQDWTGFLLHNYPDHTIKLQTADLNDKFKIRNMLNFVGFNRPRIEYPHLNRS